MKLRFTTGELARLHGVSKQTLIFYDKIGLFRPAYVDPDNGYRYYSASQIDQQFQLIFRIITVTGIIRKISWNCWIIS